MAIKPTDTFTHATGANFTLGPFVGFPTKMIYGDVANGFVPGDGIPAGHMNYFLNISGQWIDAWLTQGSDVATLDAHLIETGVLGDTNIAGLTLGSTAGAFLPLIVSENAGAPGASATIDHSTGYALIATSGGASAAIRAINLGTSYGIEAIALGASGSGVYGEGAGVDPGGEFKGGATGDGLYAIGGAGGGDGAACIGVLSGVGLRGTGGATANSSGVLGIAGGTSHIGVGGITSAAATTSSYAVRGLTSTGDATAVLGNSSAGDGYAVIAQADATAPVRAPLRTVPQDADPTSPAEGDWTYISTTDEPKCYVNSRWQTLWSTENGQTQGYGVGGSANNNNAAVFTTLVTASLGAPYAPKHIGVVTIHASAEFGASGGTVHTTIEVEIEDTTSAVVVWNRTIDHPAAVGGPIIDRPWSVDVAYAVPAIGPRSFALKFRKTGGAGTGIDGIDGALVINGVF